MSRATLETRFCLEPRGAGASTASSCAPAEAGQQEPFPEQCRRGETRHPPPLACSSSEGSGLAGAAPQCLKSQPGLRGPGRGGVYGRAVQPLALAQLSGESQGVPSHQGSLGGDTSHLSARRTRGVRALQQAPWKSRWLLDSEDAKLIGTAPVQHKINPEPVREGAILLATTPTTQR